MNNLTLKELRLLIDFMESCGVPLDTKLYIGDSRDGYESSYAVQSIRLNKDKNRVIIS